MGSNCGYSPSYELEIKDQCHEKLVNDRRLMMMIRERVSQGSNVKAGFPICRRSIVDLAKLNASVVRKPAPDFKATAVIGKEFKEIQLSQYRGKYVVLFFYPLDFTFVCPTEIVAFSDQIDKFHSLNTEVLGVSVDSHFSHLQWINTPRKDGGLGDLKYPLVADLTKSISQDYGVLLEEMGVALRGLFVIDKEGVVRHITINDLPIGRSVDETLRIIKALQFTEEHGEVCPANWNPDTNPDTIQPSVAGSKDYFNKANR